MKTIIAVVLGLYCGSLFAADFEWSGVYRLEGVHMQNSELDGRQKLLDYGLHHLSLRPKIVASDGITIYGQFELLTNESYTNSQLGSALGDGVGDGTPSSSEDSNTYSDKQKSDFMYISQLYLSWVQEYGALLAGRAPLQFGLGMTHNAGRGLFDHWFDTRDMVAYKIIMGNMSITPMYGKVNEGALNKSDDIIDYMIQVLYENPDTDLEMGIFHQVRKASNQGSDAPKGDGLIGGPSSTNELGLNLSTTNLFAVRDTERYRLGVEGSFLGGKAGVKTQDGESVSVNGFGVAAEFEYRPEDSKWKMGFKAGAASGDDPESNSSFEGFAMDRNYDVALLLFNHPLGRQDVLRTAVFGGGPTAGDIDKPDVESVSNAVYFSPYFTYQWSDKIDLKGTFTTGWLHTDPVATGDVGKDLGYETDFSLQYTPRKGILWVNEVGLLFPGSAFDLNEEKPGFAYGFVSKAAISF